MSDVRRSRASFGRLIAVALIVALTAGMTLGGAARAEDSDDRAGLVIHFGEDTIEYHVIDLPTGEINGLELLMLAGRELEIHPFAGIGEAVCAIDGHGCPGGDCFCESYSSPTLFWQFLVYEDDQWIPQHRGAGQVTVEPGSIFGWVWASGLPELPEITVEEMAALVDQEKAYLHSDIALSPVPVEEVEQQETSESERTPAVDAVQDGGDSQSGSTQCAQFLGVFSLLSVLVAWVGMHRYRSGDSS